MNYVHVAVAKSTKSVVVSNLFLNRSEYNLSLQIDTK